MSRFAIRGVRARATFVATGVVAVVLVVASALFVLLLSRELRHSLTDVAQQQAKDVAAQLQGGVSAARLPSLVGGEEALVQIVDGSGTVVAGSPSVDGVGPLVAARPAPDDSETTYVKHLEIEESDPHVVVALGVATADGPVTVITAQSLEGVEEASSVVTRMLAIGCPLVLILVAGTSYWLTGRALAPVAAMRLRVSEISSADEDADIPVSGAGDEISRLAETMNAMLARLRAAAQTQRRFVSDASHELRSPLTTIQAAHEIALAHCEQVDWRATSEETLSETRRMDRLVSDLLLLAKVDERGLPLNRQNVDLDDLIVADAHRLRRTTDLIVGTEIQAVQLQGDRHHLERLFRNLTDNAARYAATTITLRLAKQRDHAVIEISDDGPGIPADERTRVFDRFVRLGESRDRASGGTGLGLSIVAQIVAAHGGTVDIAPSGVGTKVVVVLPA